MVFCKSQHILYDWYQMFGIRHNVISLCCFTETKGYVPYCNPFAFNDLIFHFYKRNVNPNILIKSLYKNLVEHKILPL
jgi:hypothetical protein